MKRAAVIIGVDRTGGLPPLNDAARGAQRMHDWAQSQGFDSMLITDAESAVEARDIRAAVTAAVNKRAYEQLLVYFAGHGMNIRYGEYWLLSGAPDNTQEAVNVEASVTLARYCGVPHVVIISDACRSAAAAVRPQLVNGSEIFPNSGSIYLEQPVDQFYACTLGRPAYEIGDATTFTALYTSALIDGLNGALPEAVDWTENGGGPVAYVRPRRLKKALANQVSARIVERNMQGQIVQVPDARISSGDEAWLARLQGPSAPVTRSGRPRGAGRSTAADRAAQLFRSVLEASGTGDSIVRSGTRLRRNNSRGACVFRIAGAEFLGAYARAEATDVHIESGQAVQVNVRTDGASVLLVTSLGPCVVLPALRGFVVTLTMEDGQLADIAYERERPTEISRVRAVAAEQSREGLFRLDRADVLALVRKMREGDNMDPMLALYAAYACDASRQRRLVRLLCRVMEAQLGGIWFDLAMLERAPRSTATCVTWPLLSPFPMLSPGWARLPVLDMPVDPAVRDLQRFLTSSLWTSFDRSAVDLLRTMIDKGEL